VMDAKFIRHTLLLTTKKISSKNADFLYIFWSATN
jgi:hypothetical protein